MRQYVKRITWQMIREVGTDSNVTDTDLDLTGRMSLPVIDMIYNSVDTQTEQLYAFENSVTNGLYSLYICNN